MRTILLCCTLFFLSCEKENLHPAKFEVSTTAISPTKVNIIWGEAIDPENEKIRYYLLLDDILIVGDLTVTEYTLENLTVSKPYHGKVVAIDKAGNKTTALFNFQTDPIDFVITLTEIRKTIWWDVEFKNFDAKFMWNSPFSLEINNNVKYDLRVNNELKAVDLMGPDYTIRDIREGASLIVSITARLGQNTFETHDTFTMPRIPSQFFVSVNTITQSSAELSWNQSIMHDNSPVLYEVFIDDVLVKSNLTDTSVVIDNLVSGRNYISRVLAKAQNGYYREWYKSFRTL